MAATTITLGEIITRVRANPLIEPQPRFWAQEELLQIAISGCKSLWGEIIDLHQNHFQVIDTTHVSYEANTTTLTGIPTDVFRVIQIEPRDLTNGGASHDFRFFPSEYQSEEFVAARGAPVVDPGATQVVLYTVSQAGAPVGSPTITVAPLVSGQILLAFTYIPILGDLTETSPNPIPGESDVALHAWIAAFARAKERDDRAPDPAWLAIYTTEKAKILTRLTPRQEQDPDVTESDVITG